MKDSALESSAYAALGASSSKGQVHEAVSADSRFFAGVSEDVCGDPDYYSLLHADGAGTKSLVAYLCFKETGEVHWFRSLAQDSLAMNIDDLACINAFESLALSNTIGRNLHLIPGEAIREIVAGYQELLVELESQGLTIQFSGGETADLGDLVRTLVVDSTLFARVKKASAVSFDRIKDGDVIIGFGSESEDSTNSKANSGLGSNGYTLARHALISSHYLEKYPEIVDPNTDQDKAYRGTCDLFDPLGNSSMTIAEALLSPTRIFAPAVKAICAELAEQVHGIVHCTGGGQAKNIRFGSGVRYVKDSLFPTPEVFRVIQENMNVPWSEMYSVFNMGHRMEVICPENVSSDVISMAQQFTIEAKQIGHIEKTGSANQVIVKSPSGEFVYNS